MNSGGRECRLLVIGRKQSGKSTFINMVANLSQGKKYTDERLIAITQGIISPGQKASVLKCNMPEYMTRQTGVASTTQCSAFTFRGQGYVLTLIDTPGLGENGHGVEDILKCVDGSDIDGVVIVEKAKECRLQMGLGQSIQNIQHAVGKDKKVFTVFTHAGGDSDCIDGRIGMERMGIGCDMHYLMDNACILPPSVDSGHEETKKFVDWAYAMDRLWTNNVQGYSQWIEDVLALPPSRVEERSGVYSPGSIILAGMDVGGRIRDVQANGARVAMKRKALMDGRRHVPVQMSTVQQTQLNGSKRTLVCLACQHNCHDGCDVDWRLGRIGPSYTILRNCHIFSGRDECTICHHDVSMHANVDYYFETVNNRPYHRLEMEGDANADIAKYESLLDDMVKDKNKLLHLLANLFRILCGLDKRIKPSNDPFERFLDISTRQVDPSLKLKEAYITKRKDILHSPFENLSDDDKLILDAIIRKYQ